MNDNNGGGARVISIISGKGGVGKTTLVSNLSALLVNGFKKRVLAVDANITTANLGIHMGLRHPPATIHDVLEDGIPISNAIYYSFGVDVIPAAHSIGNEKALRKLRSKLRPLLQYYDFVLLDSSPGLGLEARLALRMADELLLVTNPDLSAVTEVIKMVELARKKGIPVTGIVLNRVAGRDYEVKVSEIEEACGEKVIAVIPEDTLIQKSISMRTPVVIYSPGCRASRAFEKLAEKIAGAEGRTGLLAWLHPLKILRDFNLKVFALNLKVFSGHLVSALVLAAKMIALSLKPVVIAGEKEKMQAVKGPEKEAATAAPVEEEAEEMADAEEDTEWLKESPPTDEGEKGETIRAYDDGNEEKKAD